MKRLAFSILSSLVIASPAFAIVGGPWDNNMFYGRDINGTYQGVINGKNLSGIMLFGVASTSNPEAGSYITNVGIYGNDGRVIVFTEGAMVIGQVTTVADIPGRKLNGVLEASMLKGQSSVVIPKFVSLTLTDDGPSWVYENLTFRLDDVVAITGDFGAKISKTFPWVAYTGSGKVTVETTDGWESSGGTEDLGVPFQANVKTTTKDVKIQVSGVRTSTQNPIFTGTLQQYVPALVPTGNANGSN